MKRTIIAVISLIFAVGLNAQPWNSLLPKEKVKNNTLTFFDYQKAFNDYWEPFNLDRGYYLSDGKRVKAGGWKQFKRWEWYWETRVDPVTGAFPDLSTFSILQEIKSNSTNRSNDGQWVSLGPDTSPGGYAGLGRLNCIGFHPTDNNTLYAGAASGGVWKSVDAGSSWLPISDNLGAIGISDIIIQATTGDDIVIIATGDRDHSDTYSIGVLRSVDGGSTWQTTSLSFTPDQTILINKMIVDPLNSNTFYAATTNGVYKSTDGAQNWSFLYASVFKDIELKPGTSTILYGSNANGDIYKSSDSGVSWTNVLSTTGQRTELAVSDNNSDIVYAIIANSSSGLYGIYKSTNSGNSFTSVYSSLNLLGWDCDGNDTGGQGWYDLAIAADPNNADIVYIGGINTWKSTNGGITFDIVNHWSGTCGGSAEVVHADKHNLAFQNGSSTLFECNDGGLYSSTDNGESWNHHTSGMAISQMYRLGVAQTTSDDIITGLQDNGTKSLSGTTWSDVIGGDGMECLIDYTDEDTQFGSLYYGSIYRTTNHWYTSTNISGGLSGNAAWVAPYVQDPNNSNTLFVGYQDVWKSTNQGNSWSQISNWGGSTLQSLAIAPSNSDYIFAATTNTLYSTSNGGTTWSNITGSLPIGSSSITYITVKDDDPNTIWISMGGYNNNDVFKSTNGGSSWTDISSGLPSVPTNCVVQNIQNTSQVELYAGTDLGVYLKLDDADWTLFSNNLPNVVVSELEIYYDSNPANSLIRAATFGRGLWESDLYTSTTTLDADFSATNTNIEVGGSANFTDNSTGSPTSWDWTFEGGDPATYSGQTPPEVFYDTEGTYDVTLEISDGTNSDTEIKTDYIYVFYTEPVADFTGDPTSGVPPLTVTFTDMSTDSVNTWSWDFGDGGSSTEQNPVYIYNTEGTYDVSLTVSGPGGSNTMVKTEYITLEYPEPVANFEGNPTSGTVPLTVNFTDMSTDTVNTWLWVFGDGGTSDVQNPEYIYVNPGIYSVSLTVEGPGGVSTMDKTDYITVNEGIIEADFSAEPTTGEAPLMVSFTDLSTSTGTITSWDWNFGDDGTSSDQNPEHEYLTPGNFTVSLTVTGEAGSDTEIKTDYILIPVGIDENKTGTIIVYPNPVTDILNINFPEHGNWRISISNMAGQVVYEASKECESMKISTKKFDHGTYLMNVSNGKIIKTVKVIK